MTRGGGIRDRLEAWFAHALRSVDPAAAVRRLVRARDEGFAIDARPLRPDAPVHVLAVGKAGLAMAEALEGVLGDRIVGGLAVVPDSDTRTLTHTAVRVAAHPIPDARCGRAGREAIALVESAKPGDVLVAMISGGASSLLTLPAEGLSLADVAATTDALLRSGAPIDELNTVRKHTSAVAGGRLALRAACGRIELLAISDVPGDAFDRIGSGPFSPDPTTYADALAVVAKRGAAVPERVRAHLRAGEAGRIAETPKPGEPAFDRVHSTLAANNRTALDAIRARVEEAGVRCVDLGVCLDGDASEAGRSLASRWRELRGDDPVCAIAGGETSVVVRGRGVGGRNQELALAAAIELAGVVGVGLLAVGTDGVDGPTDAAGAFADGGTSERGRAAGFDARAALADNDSHRFFAAEGGVVRTGPTGTNVMDLALLYVEPGARDGGD